MNLPSGRKTYAEALAPALVRQPQSHWRREFCVDLEQDDMTVRPGILNLQTGQSISQKFARDGWPNLWDQTRTEAFRVHIVGDTRYAAITGQNYGVVAETSPLPSLAVAAFTNTKKKFSCVRNWYENMLCSCCLSLDGPYARYSTAGSAVWADLPDPNP